MIPASGSRIPIGVPLGAHRSAVVNGGPWEVCEHAQFEGRCIVLRPGNYESLDRVGMSSQISSVRPVEGDAGYDAHAVLAPRET